MTYAFSVLPDRPPPSRGLCRALSVLERQARTICYSRRPTRTELVETAKGTHGLGSEASQEGQAGSEEELAAEQLDKTGECEGFRAGFPPFEGPALSECSAVDRMADYGIGPDPWTNEVGVVGESSLQIGELVFDARLEAHEQESDPTLGQILFLWAVLGLHCPEAVRDAAACDPMAALLLVRQRGIGVVPVPRGLIFLM